MAENIGARLRQLRGESTQEEFAKRVGLTRSALANYENGRTTPKPNTLREISRQLGISDDFLLSGQVRNEYELNLVVAGRGMLNENHSTDDEEAILRFLRAAPAEFIKSMVEDLFEQVENNPEVRSQLKGPGIETDMAILARIHRDEGDFRKGQHPLEAEKWLENFARLARSK